MRRPGPWRVLALSGRCSGACAWSFSGLHAPCGRVWCERAQVILLARACPSYASAAPRAPMRAQFFITVAKMPHLVVFGKVLQSLHWRARPRARCARTSTRRLAPRPAPWSSCSRVLAELCTGAKPSRQQHSSCWRRRRRSRITACPPAVATQPPEHSP